MKKKRLIVSIIFLLSVFSIFSAIYFFSIEKESFSVNPNSLKLSLVLQDKISRIIKITNDENKFQDFNIYFDNFDNLISISENQFSLSSKESKEIEFVFEDTKDVVGVYSGMLIIETSFDRKKIPIVVEVKDKNRIFTVNHDVLLEYNNPYSGGKLGVEIKLFDMGGKNLREIKLEHFIKNFNNELILFEQEDRTIEGALSIKKVIDISKDWEKGDYVFFTIVEYKELKSVSSYSFTVSDLKLELFSPDVKFFVVIIIIFVIGIILLFLYFIKIRNDFFCQLRKQQNKEIKQNLDLMKQYESRLKKEKHKKGIRKLRKIKREIIKKIKTKQREQGKELKKLKKKGKKDNLKKKLDQWKKQGYEMIETENQMKTLSTKEINKSLGKWKNSGYDISFLKK